jgi:charged multivesicular body protein 5
MEKRTTVIDTRIKKYDQELLEYQKQMSRMKPGAAQNAIKQRALRTLKQKKMYQSQLDQMQSQQFNMEQVHFASQTMQDTVTTVSAMKETKKALEKVSRKLDVGDVEKLTEELEDMMQDNNEIQEILGRNYTLSEDIDETELEGELEALAAESWLGDEEDELPVYLRDSNTVERSTTNTATERSSNHLGETSGDAVLDTDEYGLPA